MPASFRPFFQTGYNALHVHFSQARCPAARAGSPSAAQLRTAPGSIYRGTATRSGGAAAALGHRAGAGLDLPLG
ncbi:conserved hypothetical protein [Acidithiobacillus caldus SM-1]|uniref:Uncharacterized protein n=1 Tax=Acidithiobacillus caldus (strain SM-1) TaxID=990288 RepID=F9ZSK4_ACICS|nr:conserved hypothetical protein [Acidithiobacillus caldus SM-1]QER43878.1 hypothetical protein F0726_00798 [Acidithiobacillus caldus]